MVDLKGSFGGANGCFVVEAACELLPGGAETYDTDGAGATVVPGVFGEVRVLALDWDV